MIYQLYINGYFNYKNFLYDNALALGLAPSDILVLIYLLDEYKKGNKKINIADIENKILLHKNEISNVLSNLLEKSFYNVVLVNQNNILEEEITIEPFIKKVEEFYKNDDDNTTNKKIFSLIEKKSKRLLSATDYENINNLIVIENYDYNDFVSTINYLEKAKLDVSVRNIIKYIEKKVINNNPNSQDKEVVNELLSLFKKKHE